MYVQRVLFLTLADVCYFLDITQFIGTTGERLHVFSVIFQTAILLLAVPFLLVFVTTLPLRQTFPPLSYFLFSLLLSL